MDKEKNKITLKTLAPKEIKEKKIMVHDLDYWLKLVDVEKNQMVQTKEGKVSQLVLTLNELAKCKRLIQKMTIENLAHREGLQVNQYVNELKKLLNNPETGDFTLKSLNTNYNIFKNQLSDRLFEVPSFGSLFGNKD